MSEYSLRRRDQTDSLSGNADVAVLVELAVYLLVASFLLLELAQPPRGRKPNFLMFLIWGFSATMLLASLYSPFPALALARGAQLLVVALLSAMIARWANSHDLHRMAHAYVALVTLSVLLGAAVPFQRSRPEGARFSWLAVHPNIVGTFLAISVVVLVGYLAQSDAESRRFWPTTAYIGLLALNVIALVATVSRGAIAGAVAGCLVVVLSSSRRRWRIDVAVVTAVVTLEAIILFGEDILSFLSRGETAEQLGTLNSRTSVWQQGWELFAQRPILGHGFMSARGVFIDEFGLGGAHNAFVEVIVNSGLVGTAWWLCLLLAIGASLVRLVRRNRHADGPLLLGVFSLLLVNGLTTSGIGQAATVQNIWLFLIAGWIVGIQRRPILGRLPARAGRSAAPAQVSSGELQYRPGRQR